MVMPFLRRKVEGTVAAGVPGELDRDALWDRVFRPVIDELGCLPIRADAGTAWKLDSTLADLKLAVQQAAGHEVEDALRAIYERLERLKG
jgi:hypothetical protein